MRLNARENLVGETTSAYRMQTGVGNVRATTTVKSGYSADEADIGTLIQQ